MAGVNSDVVAFGQIRNGRIHFHNRRWFDEAIRRFRDGAEVEIEVSRRRATRSINQNAYYFGVVLQLISDYTGYTVDELHDAMKAKFIPKKLAFCDGNGVVQDELVLGGSTRKMTTIEFHDYIEQIRRFAAESLDVNIPDPDEGATGHSSERAGFGWGV